MSDDRPLPRHGRQGDPRCQHVARCDEEDRKGLLIFCACRHTIQGYQVRPSGPQDGSALEAEALMRQVSGALRSAIDAHGPVTKALIGSAAKRVVAQVLANERERTSEEATQ